jgi:hypothetical protein
MIIFGSRRGNFDVELAMVSGYHDADMLKNLQNLFPADTSTEALAIEYKVLASLSMEDKARMTFELSDNIRDTAVAGIRSLHPEYNDRQLRRELIRRMHGITIELPE